MVLDSVRALVFPSPETVSRFLLVVQSFLEDKAPMVSLWLVPGSQVRSQSLQWCLKKHWRAESEPPW
ncbi:hypothetical protein E2C01_056054 [Portunus trituberculatus]|uniref:Uncharacterized protein n=1 Tax=Portunus trituberculatus TaxID=210409 RepID=A0A5B7GX63_PORTR|nr:hypothetical protein [Portunus trituberculatus]